MNICQTSIAGTLESSDVMVTIRPNPNNKLSIQIQSIVLTQFGEEIQKTVKEVLDSFQITSAIVELNDRGAIDCVIRARVQTAVCRALGVSFNWKEEDAK